MCADEPSDSFHKAQAVNHRVEVTRFGHLPWLDDRRNLPGSNSPQVQEIFHALETVPFFVKQKRT